ncbi:MAG: hypothetical protein NTY95_02230 [Bacteroidia bacterium]|nr:hypothetical protein [Bacteroidia bacterium]
MYSLHKIPVSVLFIFLFSSASGSDPYFPAAGAAEAGMSYSCVMRPGFWSSFHNQALLPFYTSASLGFNYQNRFNISELGTRSAGLVIPAGKAGLGVIYSHFGYKDLLRHSVGLACGLKLSEKISAGIQTDFFAEKTAGEYNERRSLTFEAGLLIIPSEKIRVGFHLFNPVPNSLRKNYLPSSIRAGAGIWLSNILFACAEAEMSTGRNLNLKTGFEYEPAKNLRIRGGFSSENTSFSFGIGYILKFAQLDLGFATHERLGVTSSASIIFQIK